MCVLGFYLQCPQEPQPCPQQDVFEDDENIHLVMELCEGGELLERIESGTYSEKYIATLVRSMLRFISQVCRGREGVCTGDLMLH